MKVFHADLWKFWQNILCTPQKITCSNMYGANHF